MRHISKASLRWVRPILLTICAILIFCSLLLGYTLNALRRNMLNSSGELNKYLQQSTDARFSEIQKYATSLELNPINASLKRQASPLLDVTQNMYQFSDQMTNYKVANRLIKGVFVYYPNANIIVGNLGCHSPKSYYALDNPLTINGAKEWLEQIEMQKNGFALLQSGLQRQFCYIRPMIQNSSTVGYAVFQLNTDELLHATDELAVNGTQQSAFGILLDEQLVAFSGNGTLLIKLLNNEPVGVLQRQASDFADLQYVNAYLEGELLRPVTIAIFICVAGVLACAMFGVLASVHIGKRNTAPLRKLITRLGASSEEYQDECTTIGKAIDEIMKEKNLSEEKLQAQQILIGGMFLNEVLAGKTHSEYAIFNASKRCDLMFEHPYYMVGIIDVLNEEPDSKQCSDIMSRLINMGFDVTVSIYSNLYVLLFNVPEEIHQRSLVLIFQQLFKELYASKQVSAALGQRYDSLVKITASYNQAIFALQRRKEGDMRQVYCSIEMLETNEDRDMDDIAAMEAFLLTMQNGQYTAAAAALQPLCSRYEASMLPQEIRRVQLSALQSVLLDALRKARVSGILQLKDFRSSEILSCVSLMQLNETGGRLLNCLQGNADIPVKEESLAQRAKAIITRDFSDPMFSLYLVSEELGISSSHLSTTFKSTFGVGLVQYVNQMRINQAKSLIKNTDMSIKEIALCVGFSSDISFIRVFKKYESQTPSSLRKHTSN